MNVLLKSDLLIVTSHNLHNFFNLDHLVPKLVDSLCFLFDKLVSPHFVSCSPIRSLIETGFNADERSDVRLYYGAKNLNRMAYQVG